MAITTQELWNIPYEPYAPIRKQLLALFRMVNARRQVAGHAKIPATALRFKREIVRAFELSATKDGVAATTREPTTITCQTL